MHLANNGGLADDTHQIVKNRLVSFKNVLYTSLQEDMIMSTLLGIFTAGLLTSGVNVVRLKDDEFARNPAHFAGHYFINFHFTQPTRDNYWRVYLRPGKMLFGENMAKLSKTRHFIPVIIIPSKVQV